VLYRHVFEKFHHVARHATILVACGEVQRHVSPPRPNEPEAPVPIVHLLVRSLTRIAAAAGALHSQSRDFH
jgi:hypothetical protein